MTLTNKQKQILYQVRKNGGQITLNEAARLIWTDDPAGRKNTGTILKTLVREGHLIESAPGLFKPGTGKKSPPVDAGQTELF